MLAIPVETLEIKGRSLVRIQPSLPLVFSLVKDKEFLFRWLHCISKKRYPYQVFVWLSWIAQPEALPGEKLHELLYLLFS